MTLPADPRVDICVVTHRRPRSLLRLLGGIQALDSLGSTIRVVVVDNDPAESARCLCEEAARWLRYPLHYVSEKRRGIPQARNAGIAAALGASEFIAFIDDDEVPEADWLRNLLASQRAHDADAVAGPTEPSFETPPPRWVADSRLFDCRRHADGARLASAYSGNVLIATRALERMESLFDERMALMGGSDSEFFARFARHGHTIVWADSARAHEWIPATRVRLAWLLRRALRVGTSTAFVDRKLGKAGPGVWNLRAQGAWCVAKGSLQTLLGLAKSRGAAARGLHLASYGVGRLLGSTGWTYQEYRTTHGA